jgi:hypothetical protein
MTLTQLHASDEIGKMITNSWAEIYGFGEAVMANYKVLSWHSLGRTEENHNKPLFR